MSKAFLEKYGDKIKIKQAENLLRESDFQSIEIQPDYDARTLRNIQKNAMIRTKNEHGEFTETFDITRYQSLLIQNLVRFDEKRLTSEEIDRLEKGFYSDLVKFLTAVKEAD